jgi:hypothetical protein
MLRGDNGAVTWRLGVVEQILEALFNLQHNDCINLKFQLHLQLLLSHFAGQSELLAVASKPTRQKPAGCDHATCTLSSLDVAGLTAITLPHAITEPRSTYRDWNSIAPRLSKPSTPM